jgi:hypothetical protein
MWSPLPTSGRRDPPSGFWQTLHPAPSQGGGVKRADGASETIASMASCLGAAFSGSSHTHKHYHHLPPRVAHTNLKKPHNLCVLTVAFTHSSRCMAFEVVLVGIVPPV